MMPTDDASEVVVVARVAGAYGVRGWVRVQSFTDPAENLLEYDPWLLKGDGGWRPAGRLQARTQGQGLVAQFEGVSDRDAAEALNNALIGVPASSLPTTAADEYYWRDLVGLSVLAADGTRLGRVVEMLATGANDVMVVSLEPGGERELIPFDRRYVPEVDLERGFVRVDWAVGEYR